MLEWLFFTALILIMLVVDLRKPAHEIALKESLISSAFYVGLALLFAIFIGYMRNFQSAQEYLTAYVIEKTLSLDNVFVIAVVFNYFAIPRQYQQRVLLMGIIGVLVLRGIMIYLGAKLVSQYATVLYAFSIILILTGLKMLFATKQTINLKDNWLLKKLTKYLPLTDKLHGTDFYITHYDKKNAKNKFYVTPMFLALIFIELLDALFALDSVPAIFTITTDPYIAYTSNIFAIMGLRALYFSLNALNNKFKYLHYSLALILIFIGAKIFLPHLHIAISLSVTIGLIFAGIMYSLYKIK